MRIRIPTTGKLASFRLSLLYLAMVLSLWVGLGQARAEVLLYDDFEDAARSNTIWTFKNPSAFGVVIDQSKAHSGNGVLQMRYDPGTTGPGFEIGTLSKTVPEIFVRWYERYSSNWIWSGNGSKLIKLQTVSSTGGPMMHWHVVWGSSFPELTIEWEDISQPAIKQNILPLAGFALDRWHCIEVYHKQDNGSGNGAVKLWFDGALKLDRSGMHYHNTYQPLKTLMLSAYYNAGGNTPNGVPQLQYRWIDDVAASTTRIGCLPDTGDKNPPSAPKGLRFTAP